MHQTAKQGRMFRDVRGLFQRFPTPVAFGGHSHYVLDNSRYHSAERLVVLEPMLSLDNNFVATGICFYTRLQ